MARRRREATTKEKRPDKAIQVKRVEKGKCLRNKNEKFVFKKKGGGRGEREIKFL